MAHKDQSQLDEVKASMGVDAEANDPVTPAGGSAKGKNRPADLNKSADPVADKIEDTVKTPQGKESITKAPPRRADKKAVSEAVTEMFTGQDLSEDFKDRASIIFEGVVNRVLSEEIERLEEEFESQLDEQVNLAAEDLAEAVSKYLDYVAENWMAKNQIAVDSGIKAEMAESFISGLKNLFTENNIDIPEEQIDIVSEMTEQVEEAEGKLNEVKRENIELRKALVETQVEKAFMEMSEGMTEIQKDKLKSLVENVSYDSIDDYRHRVEVIKENYFGEDKSKVLSEGVDTRNQEIDAPDNSAQAVNPEMSRYATALSKTLRK